MDFQAGNQDISVWTMPAGDRTQIAKDDNIGKITVEFL